MKLGSSARDMKYFVIFLILIGLSGVMPLIDNALAEDPPLILSKVELWGPPSFIANNVKFCFDNTVGQLGPWAVGWIEIQNTEYRTITAQDITLGVGRVHSPIPITLEANDSCIFQTEDQITTRIGPGGSEGNGPPHGYDGSTVVFDYTVEEDNKKTHYVDTTPEISDTFGDTRVWQLVDGNWVFEEGSIDNDLQRTNGGAAMVDWTHYPVPWEDIPPLKQFKDGIDPRVIHCNDKLVLIQKYNGSPACVKPETKEKLIQRGWGTATYLDKTMEIQGTDLSVKYRIVGNATVTDSVYSQDRQSVIITLDAITSGSLTIELPRTLIDSENRNCDPYYGREEPFAVLIDREEVFFEEISTTSEKRTLAISFPENTKKIEIVSFCFI